MEPANLGTASICDNGLCYRTLYLATMQRGFHTGVCLCVLSVCWTVVLWSPSPRPTAAFSGVLPPADCLPVSPKPSTTWPWGPGIKLIRTVPSVRFPAGPTRSLSPSTPLCSVSAWVSHYCSTVKIDGEERVIIG